MQKKNFLVASISQESLWAYGKDVKYTWFYSLKWIFISIEFLGPGQSLNGHKIILPPRLDCEKLWKRSSASQITEECTAYLGFCHYRSLRYRGFSALNYFPTWSEVLYAKLLGLKRDIWVNYISCDKPEIWQNILKFPSKLGFHEIQSSHCESMRLHWAMSPHLHLSRFLLTCDPTSIHT